MNEVSLNTPVCWVFLWLKEILTVEQEWAAEGRKLFGWSHPSLLLTPPSLWSLRRAAKKFNILVPPRMRRENYCQCSHLKNVGESVEKLRPKDKKRPRSLGWLMVRQGLGSSHPNSSPLCLLPPRMVLCSSGWQIRHPKMIRCVWWRIARGEDFIVFFTYHTVSNTDVCRLMGELAAGNVCYGNSLNAGQKENKKCRVTYRTSTLLPQLTPTDFVWDEMI